MAVGGIVTLAAQNPEATIAIAKGTVRIAKGIFSVAAGETEAEPLPKRDADSQGIYGQVAEY